MDRKKGEAQMTTLGTAARGARTPSGMKVAPTSYEKLERVADGLRPLLPKFNGLGRSSDAIDCLRVLEQTLPKAGFNYMYEDVAALQDCAAFTIPERNIVVLREDVYDGLFDDSPFSRSTVIHELSHIVLQHAVTLHRGATLGQHKFFEDSEWQAKALTAAIMMPVEACVAARSAHELAQMCGTSAQSAGYRLDNLINRGLVAPKPQKGLFD
ncbi:ImmA/IrrE family metallo-endopeptidase [Burkholderia pseudomallei]|uniref:ImmA/IrrE family metallo-endopeptidase n=2 Tax=Burkholderia pseudomallei TaxID=28450 RepID=UPI001E379D47|nr:ImmA/IrrE family metallo-endopeptidase [Burkholderia pseudomallei]